MNAESIVKVAIIGCGLIGTQWDRPDTSGAFSRTHAAAFTKNRSSKLVAVCDHDRQRAEQAAVLWGCGKAFDDPARLFSEETVDLAVIASSSDARLSVLEPALKAGVKTFVIEKPLATTLGESRMVENAIEQAGAKSLVNFSRRWDPAMRSLRQRIADGGFGKIQRLVGYYGKGISNNGSHMVDLVSLLLNAIPMRARSLDSPLDPGEAGWSKIGERAVDAQIVFVDAAGHEFHLTILGTDQRAFTTFELRIVGSEAMCEISQGGRRAQIIPIKDDPDFQGYRIPGDPVALDARYRESMDRMAEEAVQLAMGRVESSSCDVHMALRTAMAVETIKFSSEEGGRWVEVDALNTH